MNQKSIRKKFTSIPIISLAIGIAIFFIDSKFFPNEGLYRTYKHNISLPNNIEGEQKLIEWNYRFPYKTTLVSVFYNFYLKSLPNHVDSRIAVMTYYKGNVQSSSSAKAELPDQSIAFDQNIRELVPITTETADSLKLAAVINSELREGDILTIHILYGNFYYSLRAVLVKTIYFIISMAYIYIFIVIRTSKFRVIAGLILSIYSIFAMEPITPFIPVYGTYIYSIIARNCLFSVAVFYGIIVRKGSGWIDYLIAALFASFIFFTSTTYSCELISGEFNEGFLFNGISKINKVVFYIIFWVGFIYSILMKIIRGCELEEYVLQTIAFVACLFQFWSTTESDNNLFYSLSISLVHIFVYHFPSLTHHRSSRSKNVEKQTSLDNLAPVRQEVFDSDGYSVSSDESYVATEDEDEEDDDEYSDDEESSENPPKKGLKRFVASRREISSDEEEEEEDDD